MWRRGGADAGSGAGWLMDRVRLVKGWPRSGGAASCSRYPLRRASIGPADATAPGRARPGRARPGPGRDPPGRHGDARARRADGVGCDVTRGAHGPAQPALGLRGRCLRLPRWRRRPARRRRGGRGAVRRADRRRRQRAAGLRVGRPGLLGGRRARDLRRGRDPPGPGARVVPTCSPGAPEKRRASSPSGRPSTPGPGASSTCAATRACGSRWATSTTSPIGSPRGGAPRRYDTRFFVAAAPPGQIAAHDAGETIAEVWISPQDALGPSPCRRDRDHLPDHPQPPGHRPLRDQHGAAGGRAQRASSAVPAIEPRVVPDGNGMRIVLPGDPGYERGAVPDPADGCRARGLQRGGARGLHAGQRGRPRHRARAPPRRTTRRTVIPAVPDFGLGPVPEPGRVDEVAPGVLRLTAPNPGLMTGPGTNTYLVGRAEPVVVDPGPADEAHTASIVRAAAPLGPVRTILVTHTHIDHAPGAAALAAATGARVVGLRPGRGLRARRACRRRLGPHLRRRPGLRAPDAACGPHAGPRLRPPVLARRGTRPPAHRRPRHARLDRGDPPARRGPAPVPGQSGPPA